MALSLDMRWQDIGTGKWCHQRIPCVDGLFEISPGNAITVAQAMEWARKSAFAQPDRREYALRIVTGSR